MELLKEADPAGIVIIHILSATKNLTLAIYIDMRVTPALQNTVLSILDANICFIFGSLIVEGECPSARSSLSFYHNLADKYIHVFSIILYRRH